MLRSTFLRCVAASAFADMQSPGATRPRYGGVLRAQLRSGVGLLRPNGSPGEANQARFAHQIFEALLRFEEGDRLRPWLALSWELFNGPKRQWAFTLRPDLQFHDGSLCDATAVVAAIDGNGIAAERSSAGDVLAASTTPAPLLRELAETARTVSRGAAGPMVGTGPFRVAEWSGERVRLEAFVQHWAGRPFLDGVELQYGEGKDPFVEVELGRAHLAEIPPADGVRAAQRGLRVWRSRPVDLLLLELSAPAAALGEALSLSVDRDAIQRVILQGEGAASAGLLPDWLTGYGFLFSTQRDLPRARQLLAKGGGAGQPVRLSFDSEDGLLRSVASRLAVDARQLGIRIELNPDSNAQTVRLRRARIQSVQPGHALRSLAEDLGRRVPIGMRSAQSVYDAEKQLLSDWRLIPIAHVPDVYVVRDNVKSMTQNPVDALGRVRLDQLWLEAERP